MLNYNYIDFEHNQVEDYEIQMQHICPKFKYFEIKFAHLQKI